MRLIRRWCGLAGMSLALLALSPSTGAAQSTLAAAAERARRAWQEHQPADLVGKSARLTVSLPGTAPADALGPAQATALFKDLFEKASELETAIIAVRPTAPEAGYVELRRRFRLAGTQEVVQQTILLAYRRVGDAWTLAEARVLE